MSSIAEKKINLKSKLIFESKKFGLLSLLFIGFGLFSFQGSCCCVAKSGFNLVCNGFMMAKDRKISIGLSLFRSCSLFLRTSKWKS